MSNLQQIRPGVVRRLRSGASKQPTLTWTVLYRFAGRTYHGNTFACVHAAKADARALNQTPAIEAWVTTTRPY